MATTQKDVAANIVTITATLGKISTETAELLRQIANLPVKDDADQALIDAVEELRLQAQKIDDMVPDAVVPGPAPGPAPIL